MPSRKAPAPAEETAIATAPAPEAGAGQEAAEQPERKYEPVRTWTQQLAGPVKYRRISDDTMRIIAFKFDLPAGEKVPEAALAVMREHKQGVDGAPTGLKFQDTRKHGKIWSLPNDAEGRILADKIDFKLHEVAQKMDVAQGKAP